MKKLPRVKISWIFGLVTLALAAMYFAPLLRTHSEQDTCSFGTVSNERYRELLAEAKRRQATSWPKLSGYDSYKASVVLNERFDDLSRGLATVYERIAAMHALLRAMGAEYRAPSSSSDDPYEIAIKGAGVVAFTYHLDLMRIGFFDLVRTGVLLTIFRRALVHAVIYTGDADVGSRTDPVRYRRGVVSFAVLFPSPVYNPFPYKERSPRGEVCPPVPTKEQAERITQNSG